jgi:hypothetical protein
LGYGLALLPPEKQGTPSAASTPIVFEVEEWSIEYGSPPLLWLKSRRAWYAHRSLPHHRQGNEAFL